MKKSAPLTFTDKFPPTFRTGNLDFALSRRDPADGFAAFTGKILMFLVLDPPYPAVNAVLYRTPPV